jgi:hypothetical protein
MPSASPEHVVAWIDERLARMFEQPRVWASTPESLEFQLLTLLEVRGVLLGHAPMGPRDPQWRRLLTTSTGGEAYVSDGLRDRAVDDVVLTETLRAAVREVVREQGTPG